MKRFIFLVALSFTSILHADDTLLVANEPSREELEKIEGFESMPLEGGDYNIHIEMRIIALPAEDTLPLIELLKDTKRIEKTVATLHEMIAKKKAKLVDWPMLITKDGQRVVVENVDEMRYATDYSPNTKEVNKEQAPAAEAEKTEEKTAGQDIASKKKANITITEGIPSAFETRNIGVTLEIEPSLDRKTMQIAMQLAAQHVSLTGFDKHTIDADGRRTTVEQPRFHTNKVTTNLTVHSGQPVLLGTYRTATPEGWLELFILKLTAKAVK